MAEFRLRYSPEINDPVGWRTSSPLHVGNPPVSPFSTIDEALAESSSHTRQERRMRSLRASASPSASPRTPGSPASPSHVRKRSSTTVGASGGRFYASDLGHQHTRDKDDGDLASMMNAMNMQTKATRSSTMAVPQYIECKTYAFPSPGTNGSESKMVSGRPATTRAATYDGHTGLHLSSGAETFLGSKKISFYGTGSGNRSGLGLSVDAVISDNFYLEGADESVFGDMAQQDIWLQLVGPGICDVLLRPLSTEGGQMTRRALLKKLARRIEETFEQSPPKGDWGSMRIKSLSRARGSSEWRIELAFEDP